MEEIYGECKHELLLNAILHHGMPLDVARSILKRLDEIESDGTEIRLAKITIETDTENEEIRLAKITIETDTENEELRSDVRELLDRMRSRITKHLQAKGAEVSSDGERAFADPGNDLREALKYRRTQSN